MITKILFGNLPAGTTADEVHQEWDKAGAPILFGEEVEGGDPDRLMFVVELEIDHKTALITAERRRDRFF